MNRQWGKAISAYVVGIPLALIGLSIVGVIPVSSSRVNPIVEPLATDARWWLLVLLFVLLWIGGPRFAQRMRAAWNAKPQPQAPVSAPKKQIPRPSPENVEAIHAFASVLESRPVGEEPAKPITAQEDTKVHEPLPAQAQRTIAMAAEIDQESATHHAAERAFKTFATDRLMSDFDENEWVKLGVLFGAEFATVNGQQRRYLTLKFLPDRSPKDGYSLLLLLFGYRQIYGWQDVNASGLEESLYRSKLRVSRTWFDAIAAMGDPFDTGRLNVDDVAKRNELLGLISEKLNLAKGGFYHLTDRGIAKAQEIFVDLVRRA